MILTASKILKEVQFGKIKISPFDEKNLGTISYKFKIGNKICPIRDFLDSKNQSNLVFEDIPRDGYLLEPGTLYLAQTQEIMGSCEYAQQIFGLRDIGSAGIFIHVSADLGHSGAITQWTLEITSDHRVKIFPFQFFGQIVFWQLYGERTVYQGDYNNMTKALPSKAWKEFTILERH